MANLGLLEMLAVKTGIIPIILGLWGLARRLKPQEAAQTFRPLFTTLNTIIALVCLWNLAHWLRLPLPA